MAKYTDKLFRYFLTGLIFLFFSRNVYSSDDLKQKREALDIISNFADKFCKDVPINGSRDSIDLESGIKAELNGVVKKITGLGFDVAAKYQSGKYEGFLQNDLLKARVDNTTCRIHIFDYLKGTLISDSNLQNKIMITDVYAEKIKNIENAAKVNFKIQNDLSTQVQITKVSLVAVERNKECEKGYMPPSHKYPFIYLENLDKGSKPIVEHISQIISSKQSDSFDIKIIENGNCSSNWKIRPILSTSNGEMEGNIFEIDFRN